MSDFDLVVIGAGVAGLTAGMVGSRFGLRTAIIDYGAAGGQVLNVDKVENFPGFPQGVPGYDLGPLIQEQAENAGCQFLFDTAESIAIAGEEITVTGAENSATTRTLIVAAGSSLRNLGIPGEEAFLGKGVSHCASCDGQFFTGQEVCVVGGGDAALDEAAVLTEHASRVTVYHHGAALRAQKAILDKVQTQPNLEVVLNTEVEEIIGNGSVAGVRLRNVQSGQTETRDLAGVFIFVGLEPNTAFLNGALELDASGHIVTDIMMRTSVPGIFAAGDIRQGSVAQLASVAGDGATAAVAAWRHLSGR